MKTNPDFALYQFNEGKISFKPTFKFDKRSDSYDTSDKQRVPAFCDRILYRGKCLRVIRYWSGVNFRLSDHRPVCCLFELDVKKVDVKGYTEFRDKINADDYIMSQLQDHLI